VRREAPSPARAPTCALLTALPRPLPRARSTGLKLQGDLGKFGRVDISDVRAFDVLPSGKVVSGSEQGMLLLWDGALIKTQLGRAAREPRDDEAALFPPIAAQAALPAAAQTHRPAAAPAHAGGIFVVLVDAPLGAVLTAGDDGALRWWDVRALEAADMLPDGATPNGLVPLGSARLRTASRVRAVVRLGAGDARAADACVGGGRRARAMRKRRNLTRPAPPHTLPLLQTLARAGRGGRRVARRGDVAVPRGRGRRRSRRARRRAADAAL
jgi:hypothetical protein